MCGIIGFLSKQTVFSEDNLKSMTNTLAHRGPDASGCFFDGLIGLGHRRLSIIDVSDSANQPMHSTCSRYVMVFNGEIYNYQEIRSDLEKEKRIQFFTNSDTEVILEAFVHWGSDFVSRLNGMFAMAIFDKHEKTLHIFRDRIGVKPLYYFYDGSNFAFSSELKSLLIPDFIRKNSRINNTAINEYLHLGYIPEPHSIYNSIQKFPAAHYAVVSEKGIAINRYWNSADFIKPVKSNSFLEAKEQLKELLISAVKYRLICDVPFGTFLSGGIDSSLVTAIAQHLNPNPISTFSIGFLHQKYDESGYAKAVADYLGTNHHEFRVSEIQAINLIPELINVFDEPFADSSAIPTMLVSKLARQHVTMTLSGDGGDELFMGYGAYTWANRLKNPLIKFLSPLLYTGFSLLNNKYKRAAELFDTRGLDDLNSHIFSQEQNLFKQNELSGLLNKEVIQSIILKNEIAGLPLSAKEAQAFFDLNFYLKDDLLVKVDRASMHYALETRVPLLDYRIVEFALNLNEELKVNKGVKKHLLKEVLYDFVPAHFFNRPKWGFSVPLQEWLTKDLSYLVDEFLSEDSLRQTQVLNPKFVHQLLHRFISKGHHYLYNRIWSLIMLQQFLKKKI